jgi:phosphoenolpyruvate carboxylase
LACVRSLAALLLFDCCFKVFFSVWVMYRHGSNHRSASKISRYSEWVSDARLRKKIFTAIELEWHRTASALAMITGDKQRLANNAALQRSMHHRFP